MEENDYLYCRIDDLERETDMLRDYIKELSTKLVLAKHALQFYADKRNYKQQWEHIHIFGDEDDSEDTHIFDDRGNKAKEALTKINKKGYKDD